MGPTQDKNLKGCVITLFAIIFIAFIVFIITSINDDENSTHNETSSEYNSPSSSDLGSETNSTENEENLKTKLEKEINDIENGKDFSSFRKSRESILIEIALFSYWTDLIMKASVDTAGEISSLGKKLEKSLKKIQLKEFPLLRKSYAEFVKNKLWESDIDVTISGNNYTTITLIGAVFASNKNKQDVQNELSEILNILRFKRINYKWYKYDDEYTYWKLYEGKDTDPVITN